MALVEGMGTCLVPKDTGVPCASQIQQGEPIRTISLPFGGTVVGHKACVDAYDARKNQEKEDDMVKRVDQSGPGGAVDMTQARDATMGSLPLETKRDGTTPTREAADATTEASTGGNGGEWVKPVADIPLGSPPPEAQLPAGEVPLSEGLTSIPVPKMREFTPPKEDDEPDAYAPEARSMPTRGWKPDDISEIDNRFTYHPPSEEQVERYTEIRDCARHLAHVVNELCPSSHERVAALDHLDSAVMFANAAIARHS